MRISRAVIETIVERESYKKFNKRKVDAEKAYSKAVNEAAEKKWGSLKIPDSLEVYIQKGSHITIKFSHNDSEYVTTKKAYPKKPNDYRPTLEATDEIKAARKSKQDLIAEEGAFEKDLTSCLYNFSSSKKLIEAMPELAKHFDEIVPTGKAMGAVEKINQIRKELARP
jgi:hypothetical protein